MTHSHTPTPWHVRKQGDQITIRGPEVNGLSMEIADINPHINPFTHGYSAEDNAAFIVRCVNSHEELVKAGEDLDSAIKRFLEHPAIIKAMNETMADETEIIHMRNMCAAALAKATGEA